MAILLNEPELKQTTCSTCKAKVGYLPEEAERYIKYDYGGGFDTYERVKCPRPGCTGYGVKVV